MKIPQLKIVTVAEQTNSWFKKLNGAQKRVAIAMDVLAQIKAKKYLLRTGIWCEIGRRDGPDSYDQELLLGASKNNSPECTVCAMGSLLCSTVRLGNDISVNEEVDFHEMSNDLKQLSKFFSKEQMSMIEIAFEVREHTTNGDFAEFKWGKVSEDRQAACIKFGNRYQTDEKRAIAIFSNIIKNNGEFKP